MEILFKGNPRTNVGVGEGGGKKSVVISKKKRQNPPPKPI